MNTRALCLTTLALCLPFFVAGAAHVTTEDGDYSWTRWRGPDRDGLSRETSWSVDGKPEDLWRAEVGMGYSAVVVAEGRLYTMGFDEGAGSDLIWCLDAATGEELWVFDYPAKIMNNLHEGGTLSTPTIDGDAVFTANREGMVHCFDAATGDVRWSLDIKPLVNVEAGTWGFAASPIVDGDDLILNVGKIAVLEKTTGELKWASKNYGHSYSTPSLCDVRGTAALALFNSDGLAVIERAGGKERYFHPWTTRHDINAATPQVIGDSIFISSGYNHGCALLKMGAPKEGKEAFEVEWENRAMRSKMSGCVLVDGFLYGYDEAMFRCVDLKGEVRWSQRGLGNGALTAAGGKLIMMTGDGELIIAKATEEGFEELSRTQVIEGGKVFWTVPVLVNGRIYCRGSRGTLVCRDHRG
jgi:outer membrane protein assembly factor BamB